MGGFKYIAGWLNYVALNRVILSALKNAKLEFFDLPIGVRIQVISKKRFWFNYSSKVQKNPVSDLKPGGVFIESIEPIEVQ